MILTHAALSRTPTGPIECSVCGKVADGTVTANGLTDGWCDRHAAAVMAAAILAEPATPPSVEILDVDSYRTGGWPTERGAA